MKRSIPFVGFLLLAPAMYFSRSVPGLDTDVAAGVLGLVAAQRLFKMLTDEHASPEESGHDLLMATLLLSAAACSKMSLVVFAAVSFVQCPLTLDYNVLLGLLDEIEIGMVEDGTAIGMAMSDIRSQPGPLTMGPSGHFASSVHTSTIDRV